MLIELALKNPTLTKFKQVLSENELDVSDFFMDYNSFLVFRAAYSTHSSSGSHYASVSSKSATSIKTFE